MNNILNHWTYASSPRPNQIAALEWIEEQTAKYIILQAPVGSGKSLIGLTYSSYLSHSGKGNSYILTPQRILQSQYERTYINQNDMKDNIASLYGKSNYDCKSKNTTCDIGNLVTPRCVPCPRATAFANAKSAHNTVFNYKLALLLFGYTESMVPRPLMVLDECHTLEDHLTEFNAVTIHDKRVEKFGLKWRTITNIEQAYEWLKDVYVPKAQSYLETMFLDVEPLLSKSGVDLSASEIKTIKEYNKLEEHIDSVNELIYQNMNDLKQNYVLVHDAQSFKFKQLTAAENFKLMLEPQADRFLFMSSTILDHKQFCNDLGINIDDAAFLSMDSDFPVAHRPVYYAPIMKMNASWTNPENKIKRNMMLDQVEKILKLHEGESGIIHTGNFKIAKWLVEELDLDTDHQILHHNPDSGDDRNAIINQFTSDPKTSLLISPSITEGLDLYDDLSRFAIFVKISFPYLGDQWIKQRCDMSQAWYMRKTIIDVIQGTGRVVRSKEDWGNTYILDESFAYLKQKTWGIAPEWWRNSVERI